MDNNATPQQDVWIISRNRTIQLDDSNIIVYVQQFHLLQKLIVDDIAPIYVLELYL